MLSFLLNNRRIAISEGRWNINFIWNWETFIQIGCVFYIPGSNAWKFQLFHVLANSCYQLVFLILAT